MDISAQRIRVHDENNSSQKQPHKDGDSLQQQQDCTWS